MRFWPTRSARSWKLQYLIAAIVPALIVTLSITGFVWAQKEVTVVVDGRSLSIKTHADSVAAALAEAGVSVDRDDVVDPPVGTSLAGCETIVVRHSVPVTLDLGGSRVSLDIVGETVADALVAAGADPSANPAVTPSADTRLTEGMVISVPDVFMRVTNEEATLPPRTRLQKDPSLPAGTRRIIATGSTGRVLRVYRVLVTNGVEGTPVLTTQKTLEPAQPRIVAVGTGHKGAIISAAYRARGSARPPRSGRRMVVETTGYSAQQPDLDDTTATGARARHGVIAVDPRVIPLGTHVYVPGYGYAVAADTGGAIHGKRVDLCFDTVAEALQWGRRTTTIIILD